MQKYAFDRGVFNRQWAFPFTVLQYATIAGFILMLLAVVLGAATDLHLTVPTPAVVLLLIAFVAFPIVSVIKMGYRRSLQWSSLSANRGEITYDKLTEKGWTALGPLEEHRIFIIERVDNISATRRHFQITGKIHQKKIDQNQLVEEKEISSVRIPRAYAHMEDLMPQSGSMQA